MRPCSPRWAACWAPWVFRGCELLMMRWFAFLAPSLIQVIELMMMIAAGVIIFRAHRRAGIPPVQPAAVTHVERAFAALAHRKRLSVICVALVTLGVRAALIPILGIPEPHYNDEFMFVLAGDTFAHGRITN